MSIPNRLDRVAQPFCRRWRLGWDAWSRSGSNGVSGDELAEAQPMLHRELESMAYRLLRFNAGMGNLLAMSRRPQRLPDDLRSWFEHAPVPGWLDERQQGDGLWLQILPLPGRDGDLAEPCDPAGGWRLRAWGGGPVGEGGAFSGWSALLRLRPLREFWVHQLRAKHVAALAQVLGPEWIEPDNELPAGATLPGLAQWSGLAGEEGVANSIPEGWQRQPLWPEGGPTVVLPPWPQPVGPGWLAQFSLSTDAAKRARLLALHV